MLLLAPLALATTYLVDPAGTGDALTIEDGMALLSDGDTLQVAPGVYYEKRLGPPNGTRYYLEGAGADETIIDGTTLFPDDPDAYLVSMDGGIVSGITFRGLPTEGWGFITTYDAVDGMGVSVDACRFEDLWVGVSFASTPVVSITNSTFVRTERAIWTMGWVGEFSVRNAVVLGSIEAIYANDPSTGTKGDYWSIAYNTFVGNESGLTIKQGSSNYEGLPYLWIVNNVIAGSPIGIAIEGHDALGYTGRIENNLISSDVTTPEFYYETTVTHDNTIGDPAFLNWSDDDDWTNDDFHLGWGSGAIDLGREGFDGDDLADRDGVPRPIDGDLDTIALPDAGAYEAAPDVDGDGYATVPAGGTDCDDADASIHPGVEDVCGDGIDQDCSGSDEECPDTGDTGSTSDTDSGGDSAADTDTVKPGPSDTGTSGDSCGCGARQSLPGTWMATLLGVALSVGRRRSPTARWARRLEGAPERSGGAVRRTAQGFEAARVAPDGGA